MDHDKAARRALLIAKALKHHASVIHNPASIMGNPPPPVARYGMVSPHLTQIAPVARADGGDVNKALNVVGQQQADPVAVAKQVASMPPARQLSPMGLYSHGAEAAAALPQAKGSPQQMKATLRGVKPEELAGYDDAFGNKKSVTKDEIAQHFQQNMPQVEERVLHSADGDTKFGTEDLTLPGGKNYREVLLKYEPNPSPISEQKYYDLASKAEREVLSDAEKDQMRAYTAWKNNDEKKNIPSFKSSHWDDPNVLAHLRMSDRTGPNGEKILHVEEIQSDWGQKGKKEGFINAEAKSAYDKHINELKSLEKETKKLMDLAAERLGRKNPSYQDAVRVVPELEAASSKQSNLYWNIPEKPEGLATGPYVTSTHGWTDLALKRALREAAEGGYDKLVWTPGAEQAKRYDLSKQVGKIYYDPELAGGTLAAEGLRPGQTILDKPNIKPENIADYIGKEAAEKLLSQPRDPNGMHMLEGNGLSMGGEGMKGYYDKIVPKRLQELVKKHDPDAKVGYTDVMLPPKGGAGHNNPPFAAPGLTITPKMRESILKGQPAFKRGGNVKRKYEKGGIVQGEAPIHALHLTSKFGNSLPSAVNQAKAATRRRP